MISTQYGRIRWNTSCITVETQKQREMAMIIDQLEIRYCREIWTQMANKKAI